MSRVDEILNKPRLELSLMDEFELWGYLIGWLLVAIIACWAVWSIWDSWFGKAKP